MAERWTGVDLEEALFDLGRHVEYPPTPELARIVALAPRPRSVWRRIFASPLRVATAAVAVLLVVLLATLTVSPEARSAVAERLGLRGAPIEQISRVPSLIVSPITSPTVEYGAGLDLGRRTTLSDASSNLPLLLPTSAELGHPDAVYLAPTSLGGTVSLVYAVRPALAAAPGTGVSLLVLESRLPPRGFESSVLGKGVGPETRLEELRVNGGRGVWLEGAPHLLYLPDAYGQFKQESVRLAGNVLLWEQGGLLLRLEAIFSRDQALQIAASVH